MLHSCHMLAQQALIFVNSAFFFLFAVSLGNFPVDSRASSSELKWEEFN